MSSLDKRNAFCFRNIFHAFSNPLMFVVHILSYKRRIKKTYFSCLCYSLSPTKSPKHIKTKFALHFFPFHSWSTNTHSLSLLFFFEKFVKRFNVIVSHATNQTPRLMHLFVFPSLGFSRLPGLNTQSLSFLLSVKGFELMGVFVINIE